MNSVKMYFIEGLPLSGKIDNGPVLAKMDMLEQNLKHRPSNLSPVNVNPTKPKVGFFKRLQNRFFRKRKSA